jgi:predicted DNA-binding transcriptional regulator AlpA
MMLNLRDDYITAKEVAYNFGYSNIKSFYNAVNAGRFPLKPVVFGKRWYFAKDSVQTLLAKIVAA